MGKPRTSEFISVKIPRKAFGVNGCLVEELELIGVTESLKEWYFRKKDSDSDSKTAVWTEVKNIGKNVFVGPSAFDDATAEASRRTIRAWGK